MLSRLRLSALEAAEAFETIARQVYLHKSLSAKDKSNALRQSLEDLLKQKAYDRDTILYDSSSPPG